jgi:hypothetical protein
MARGIETKIEAPEQGSNVMMSEIALVLNRQTEILDSGDSSKSSDWGKRIGALMVVGTVLAVSMVGGAKEAEARQQSSQVIENFVGDVLRGFGDNLQRSVNDNMQMRRRITEDAIRQRQNMEMEQFREMQRGRQEEMRTRQNLVQSEYQRYNQELQQISQQKSEAERMYMHGQMPKDRYYEVMNNLKQREAEVKRQFSGGGSSR